jgi:hypothetical protein
VRTRPQQVSQDQVVALDRLFSAVSASPIHALLVDEGSFISDNAVRTLVRSPALENLSIGVRAELWVVIANEIQQGYCRFKQLFLYEDLFGNRSTAQASTDAFLAMASVIRYNGILERLKLMAADGVADEAGVASALEVNTTLRQVGVGAQRVPFGVNAYDAFSKMLRANTNLQLTVPCLSSDASPTLQKHYKELCIEIRLNEVGRGRLLESTQTPREAWFNAMDELNNESRDETCGIQLDCLYSLLQLNPEICEASGASSIAP